MRHRTPACALLATTLKPVVLQLSGSLAHGVNLVEVFRQGELTPQKMLVFERELNALLREVGRCIVSWVLNHLESESPRQAPPRLGFQGRLYRRRRKHPQRLATLFGTVVVWRLLYEPREGRGRCLHPVEMRLGIQAGLVTPALADRLGTWAADHTQRQVLEMLASEHHVKWSCTTLRKLLESLRRGMSEHRQEAQVTQVVRWLNQARLSTGRFRPTLSVGRDGIFVPLRHGIWQEGAVATVSVLNRRGQRLGTVYLGQMPEAGQGTLTQQLSALLHAVLSQVESQRLRLVYVSDEGYHPSAYYHDVLARMVDPRRPWRHLEWIRIVDFYHVCQYIQKLSEALFGVTAKGQAWSRRMRQQLKTISDGVARVLLSACSYRRQRGLTGQATVYDQAYAYLKKRSRWMHYKHYRSQGLPIGSGITEAGCKVVFTQRLKRSGMSWTRAGGQVILDLRVIWLSGVWDDVYQRYLASKPIPMAQMEMRQDVQQEKQAA